MKKSLEIHILEYVKEHPEKLPIQDFVIPEAEGTPLECLLAVKSLIDTNYLTGNSWSGRGGVPLNVSISSITLSGQEYLANWNKKDKENRLFSRLGKWTVDKGDFLAGALFGGILTEAGKTIWEVVKKHFFH